MIVIDSGQTLFGNDDHVQISCFGDINLFFKVDQTFQCRASSSEYLKQIDLEKNNNTLIVSPMSSKQLFPQNLITISLLLYLSLTLIDGLESTVPQVLVDAPPHVKCCTQCPNSYLTHHIECHMSSSVSILTSLSYQSAP